MWRLWAKALGQKDGRDVKEADKIAIIRTLIMIQLVVTNGFIIAGNVKNLWFSNTQVEGHTTYGEVCGGSHHIDTNTSLPLPQLISSSSSH